LHISARRTDRVSQEEEEERETGFLTAFLVIIRKWDGEKKLYGEIHTQRQC
jgi:hypothetical protein